MFTPATLLIHHYRTHLLVRGSKTIKTVQLTENEVRNLCLKSSEIFLSQPILLELEAPLKICGEERAGSVHLHCVCLRLDVSLCGDTCVHVLVLVQHNYCILSAT